MRQKEYFVICYVAGLDPESGTAAFRAVITMDAAGEPVITWEPTLEADEAELRTYTTYGKPSLEADAAWRDVETLSAAERKALRFFKVGVEMK